MTSRPPLPRCCSVLPAVAVKDEVLSLCQRSQEERQIGSRVRPVVDSVIISLLGRREGCAACTNENRASRFLFLTYRDEPLLTLHAASSRVTASTRGGARWLDMADRRHTDARTTRHKLLPRALPGIARARANCGCSPQRIRDAGDRDERQESVCAANPDRRCASSRRCLPASKAR